MEQENTPKKPRAKKAVEPKVEQAATPVNSDYSKERYDQLVALAKLVSPSKEQMDLIFELHNVYCTPKMTRYSTSCQCAHSIITLYWRLVEWFKKNKELFETK